MSKRLLRIWNDLKRSSVPQLVSSDQSVTYRYREFPVPGIFQFFGGIGTGIRTNWYQKKVSEPVAEKFGTEKSISIGIVQHFGYCHTLRKGDLILSKKET